MSSKEREAEELKLRVSPSSESEDNGEVAQSESVGESRDQQKTPLTLPPQYKILAKLGEGGMGSVYLGRNQLIDRLVAIKVFTADSIRGETMMRRFQQEGRAASKLNHLNLAQLYEFGVSEEGLPYMVMEYVEGQTLSDYIEEHGVLSVEAMLTIAKQMCDGLEHAHERGVIHRDIKPTNIMIVNREGNLTAKLVDFGIAKVLESDEKGAQQITREGDVFGSPLYMSPEQASGRSIDKRSDIYSLACVLYEALTGHAPLMGATVLETLGKKLADDVESIVSVSKRKDVPPGIDKTILRGLSRHLEERHQTMREFWTDLERGAEGKRVKQVSKKPKAVPRKLLVLLCVIFAVLGAVVAISLNSHRNSEPLTASKVNPPLAKMKSNGKNWREHTSHWYYEFKAAQESFKGGSYTKAKDAAEKALQAAESFDAIGVHAMKSLKLLSRIEDKLGNLDAEKRAEKQLANIMHQLRCDRLGDPLTNEELILSRSSSMEKLAKAINDQVELTNATFEEDDEYSEFLPGILQVNEKLPKDSVEYVRGLINAAVSLAWEGRTQEAKTSLRTVEPLLKQKRFQHLRAKWLVAAMGSKLISTRAIEEELPKVANTADEYTLQIALGDAYTHNDADVANQHYERAGEIANKLYGPKHKAFADTILQQAQCQLDLRNPSKAAELYNRALEIYKDIAPVSRWTAICLSGLGKAAWDQNDRKTSVDYYLQSLDIQTQVQQPTSSELAQTCVDTAEALWSFDNHDPRIIQFAQQAEDIYRKNYPGNSRFADALNLVGNVAMANGNYKESERAYKEALIICKASYKPGDRRWDLAYENLSICYRKFKHFDKLRDITLEKMAIEQKVLGPTHREIACDYYFLGDAYRGLKQYEKATEAYENGMKITKIAAGLESYAKMLRELGQKDKANELEQEAGTLKGPGL